LIVIDASAIVAILLGTEQAEAVRSRIATRATLHAPHLIDLEVTQVLRRHALLARLSPEAAEESFRSFRAIAIERYAHDRFLDRIWQMRWNITAYDAAYIALAEALRAPVLTCDARLAASAGHTARIELVR
jgi:predicted nucleic acid-binding protein